MLSRIFSFMPLASVLIAANVCGSEAPINEADYRQCLARMSLNADKDMTLEQLRSACKNLAEEDPDNIEAPTPAPEPQKAEEEPALETRLEMEALNRSNRFVLTPHNRNYLLPAVYTDTPNERPFEEESGEDVNYQNIEIEFQISMKVLLADDIFHNNGNLYVAYTNQSFWQAYNTEISRPFRETNHEPELILSVINNWEIFGFRNVMNQLIVSHQSNGQSGLLSRSWNRVKGRAIFERGNLAFSITPWYRLPEDSEKDDNPDIDDFYGHYELAGAYTRNDHIVSFMTRRPFSDKGALQLDWSFPISSTVRGYVKLFDGYGASLIDYNIRTQSIGLGVTFTDIF
ncbi:phospholipase A [Gilvimarinus chinensis]|uniref:phospholipase A n=1 Tax=Gilvimarinus chinensis TaxID=396005 RepID=UPI00035EACF6|nr:phospholipase A [Gilvimarinus chinensis]